LIYHFDEFSYIYSRLKNYGNKNNEENPNTSLYNVQQFTHKIRLIHSVDFRYEKSVVAPRPQFIN